MLFKIVALFFVCATFESRLQVGEVKRESEGEICIYMYIMAKTYFVIIKRQQILQVRDLQAMGRFRMTSSSTHPTKLWKQRSKYIIYEFLKSSNMIVHKN